MKVYVLLLALFCMEPIWPMQKGSPLSLAQLAIAAYVKKILASETMPTQEYIDKVIPKDLHPLIAQMLVKPVVEYMRDWAFSRKLITRDMFKLSDDTVYLCLVDNAFRFLVILDMSDKAYIFDIKKSFENFRNNADPHIITTFENIKNAVLSDDGSRLALVNNNNNIDIYNTKLESFEHVHTIEDIPYTIGNILLDKIGFRVYVGGETENTISIFDIASGLKKADYSNVLQWDIDTEGKILYILKDDHKTIITFDIESNKQIAQRVFDNQTITRLDITRDGKVCALLTQDMAGTKHIDILSPDLKTNKSFSVVSDTRAIYISPKGSYIVLDSMDTMQFLRTSDGHILNTQVYSRVFEFNPDETRVLFEKFDIDVFELINLMQDKEVVSYEYLNDENTKLSISFINYMDNNTFSMVSEENDSRYFKLINFLSDEALKIIKNISMQQAWILRTLYEANQRKIKYAMSPEVYDVLITLPHELRDPFVLDFDIVDVPQETKSIQEPITEKEKELVERPDLSKEISVSQAAKPTVSPTSQPSETLIKVFEPKQKESMQSAIETKPVGFFDTMRNGITNLWGTIKSWWR
jgi:WD40 repeat protein